MKKVFLFVAFSAFATLGFSQSKWMFEGNVSLGTVSGDRTLTMGSSSTTTPAPTTLNFNIGVHAAYLITDKFAVGLGFSYGMDKKTTKSGTGTSATEDITQNSLFTILPQAHLFLPLNDKFVYAPSLYLGIGFGGNSEKNITGSTTTETTTDISGFGVELHPLSFDFHLTNNIALHLGAGTIHFHSGSVTSKPTAGSEVKAATTNFDLSLNPSINLGFRLFF